MDVRFLDDMKKVLSDKKWAKNAPNFELYYMERGLKKKKGLRYDITTIPPRMLGKEFVKTKGHEHFSPVRGQRVLTETQRKQTSNGVSDFGEIYIVLKGEGIYLMQKYKKGKIEDVYAVKAKKGDIVVIPPYYGHVTINPLKKELKMANWVSEKCKSNYRPFEKMEGACYYFTKSGWLKNKKYKNIPKLRFEKPLKKMPTDLGFLKG